MRRRSINEGGGGRKAGFCQNSWPVKKNITRSCEVAFMPSFQHFQQQAGQKSAKPKFSNDTLNLSMILQYAESAKKQSFEALCRVQPLVKSYRDKIDETSKAMIAAESSLGGEADIPPDYAAAFSLVKEGFSGHLTALDAWMGVLMQKNESKAEDALVKVKQSGEQLEASLKGLEVPK